MEPTAEAIIVALPIWVVIGGAILAGVITGFGIGLLFHLLKYLMSRGNQAPGRKTTTLRRPSGYRGETRTNKEN